MCGQPELGQMIGYCGHLGKLCTDKYLRSEGHDITHQQSHAMIFLFEHRDSEVNQRDIERELHLRPSTINGILSRLEEKGYVARAVSPADGRFRIVRLTDAGTRKVEAFHAALKYTNRLFSAVLSEEELTVLRELLSRIIAKLENILENNLGNNFESEVNKT